MRGRNGHGRKRQSLFPFSRNQNPGLGSGRSWPRTYSAPKPQLLLCLLLDVFRLREIYLHWGPLKLKLFLFSTRVCLIHSTSASSPSLSSSIPFTGTGGERERAEMGKRKAFTNPWFRWTPYLEDRYHYRFRKVSSPILLVRLKRWKWK